MNEIAGVTPNVLSGLELISDRPALCHALTPFARGRMYNLGLAQKVMLPAPREGFVHETDQLHYKITSLGVKVLEASKKGAD